VGVSMAAEDTEAAVTADSVPLLIATQLRIGEEIMQNKRKVVTIEAMFAWVVTAAVLLMVVFGGSRLSFAQEQQPKTFSSPGQASNALFEAAQNEDEQALEAILGAGTEVTSSNDEVEDKLERERFSQKYQEMHRLVREPDGLTVLYIGAENWPFPIPLVSKNGAWYFDSDSGLQEILFRTVGENETKAIQLCHALVTAKNQEPLAVHDDEIIQYARGLAAASKANSENNDRTVQEEASPFHGYYFRLVPSDSASASEGKHSLVAVAYPAQYQSLGVMTFIVTNDGKVYEKDLGPDTTKVAQDIKAQKPNSSWHRATLAESGGNL
jgi:Protein of unknown function (DUF2950)